MKVLYLISVRGHGRGGHFHSLNHISSAMGDKIEVGICSLGTGKSDVIRNNPYFINHIYFNGYNLFTLKAELKKTMKEFNPDIIHCFDVAVYNIFTLIFPNKYKIILNKCGGPNPIDFPFVQNLILFSEENKKWFSNNPKFKNTDIKVIPNRVNNKLVVNNLHHETLPKKDAFCFVRIARIGTSYKKSIEESINLANKLLDNNKNVHLYLIGAIENQEVFDQIKNKTINLPITILTENQYTQKASDMLYLADAVIATGRGVMEATAIGKPILTPAVNSDIPVLVDENSLDTFFKTNFSQRNVATERSLAQNYENISSLIEDNNYYQKMNEFSLNIFREHFDLENGVPKYLEFYNNTLKKPHLRFSFLKNFKLKIKTLFIFIKNAK